MVFVVTGIHEILFSLWLAVIAVRHHEIPMNILIYHIKCRVKSVIALSHVFDYRCAYTCLLFHFSQGGLIVLLALFNSSLGENLSFVFVLVIFIQKKDLAPKNHHTATARCFNHCNSSCHLVCFSKLHLAYHFFNRLTRLTPLFPEIRVKYLSLIHI